MNKTELLNQLVDQLQQEIDATLNAVNEAHALASHEQSKPENQYDTLALEAAYLAHGQSERVAELQRQVMLLKHFDFLNFNDDSRISLGAIVCVEELNTFDKREPQWLWLVPAAGGVLLSTEEQEIRTITAKTPLAVKLLGCYLGDDISLNLGHIKKQFEIVELL